MSMRLAEEVAFQRTDEQSSDGTPISNIVLNGKLTGKQVSGALLEAAIAWYDKYLLLTTDDCPFEEFLGIRLLDRDLNLLDSASLGMPYNTGSLSELALQEPDTVSFKFIGEGSWQIKLLAKPALRIPFLSEPSGVWRNFNLRRHFVVQGKLQPE